VAEDETNKLDLRKFVQNLTDGELRILEKRLGRDISDFSSLDELAVQFNISDKSVKRIEKLAKQMLAKRGIRNDG